MITPAMVLAETLGKSKISKDEIDEILRAEGLAPQGGRLPPTEEEVYTKLDAIVDVSIILLCVLFTILY